MSFLRDRRPTIGALKSVRADKHGQGTGKEAETGRNKPGNYSGFLSTAFGGFGADFFLRNCVFVTT
jgi:hypothetical protein